MAKSKSTEDLGEPIPFDPDFRGPLKNRSCTDILCLLLFLVFIACWLGIGIYAITNGDINTLFAPKDSKGRRCGLDAGLENKPYLFFFDLTKCFEPTVPFTGCNTRQICVKKCPEDVYIKKENIGNLDRGYCDEDKKCPDWYLPSNLFENRCIPSPNFDKDIVKKIEPDMDKFTKAIDNIKVLSDVEQVGENIVKDIVNAWWKIVIGILIAVVICIIYILMLRWLAGIMVWFSMVGIVAALSFGVYFTTTKYLEFKDKSNKYEEDANDTKQNLWLAALIVCAFVLVVILLMLIFLRNRIILAIALIKEGSKAVSSVTSVLFFPIFPWILQIGVIAFAIIVGMYLATTGTPEYQVRNSFCSGVPHFKNGSACDLKSFTGIPQECLNPICKFVGMKNPPAYPYLQTYNVFAFFWVAFFVSALGEMILASVFAQWYWTYNKRNLPFFSVTEATLRTLRYHIGTLAFGSLIIAICRMIRVCLEYIDHKLKKYDNPFTKAILCCLKCFFWCLEKFLRFINKNAYIMCAVHGKNFCASAKDAFLLLMRNIIRVFVLDKVTEFLFFLSKLLVTVGVGAIAYVFFATDLTPVDNSRLNYTFVPIVVIMVCTYLISSVFFNVYSMAVDTLFMCFLEDSERNDGSSTKPYFMSKNLMKILGKKNKRA